jgi:hypothetical protein
VASFIRIGLVVAALMLAAAQSAEAGPIASVIGFQVPATSAPTQNGKLAHGSASACSPAKAAPAVDNSGTQFNYSDLGVTSFINESACVTVSFTTADPSCWSNGLYSASYLGTFNPNDIQAGYLGDSGASPSDATPKAYSMTLAPGGTLDTVFHMSVAGTGCSSFDVAFTSDRPFTTARPRISGHPFVGETLTAFDGGWTSGTVTRQWRRCALDGSSCADIPGATGGTYVAVPDDVGHSLTLHSTATDGGGTSTSDSPPLVIGIQFEDISGQSLSGTDPTQKGRLLLNAAPGTCPAPKGPSATDTTHDRFYDAFTRSNQSDSTLCVLASLEATSACTSGGPISAAYAPQFDPASVARRYLADGGLNAVQGLRIISYGFEVPAGADYAVVVTGSNPGATCPSYDLRLGATAPYPTALPPTVEGTAMQGQTLRATPGSWTGSPVITFQWQRCFMDGSGCTDVPGAITTDYKLSSSDVGHSLRVRATATEGAGSASKSSAATAPVAATPPAPFPGIALKRATVNVRPNGVVNLTLSCPASATLACLGTDTLKLGKQRLGSKSFLIAGGAKGKLRFTLSKKVRKQLAKKKKLKATQTVVSRDARRLPATTTAQLTLKFKKH